MQTWKYVFGGLLLVISAIALALSVFPDSNLHLIACSVGQGDAILASFGSFQILTDGGPPNNKVSGCLSRHMPFWDREIELIVLTHPQLDHFGGLNEVFNNYKVDNFLASPLNISTTSYEVLKKTVGGYGTRVITPSDGLVIRYGLLHLDIFWPTAGFLKENGWDKKPGKIGTFESKRDSNSFSVQSILSLGDFDALLSGDIGQNMADKILSNVPKKKIEYIKIPHHGSKNGLTYGYLDIFNPSVAVISVGKDNRFGHPHKEILNILNEEGIKILRTDEGKDIEVVTDGRKWWIK